jgi:hypothetical protein
MRAANSSGVLAIASKPTTSFFEHCHELLRLAFEIFIGCHWTVLGMAAVVPGARRAFPQVLLGGLGSCAAALQRAAVRSPHRRFAFRGQRRPSGRCSNCLFGLRIFFGEDEKWPPAALLGYRAQGAADASCGGDGPTRAHGLWPFEPHSHDEDPEAVARSANRNRDRRCRGQDHGSPRRVGWDNR